MSKFKIGDEVECIDDGEIGVIREIDRYSYLVRFKTVSVWYPSYGLKFSLKNKLQRVLDEV